MQTPATQDLRIHPRLLRAAEAVRCVRCEFLIRPYESIHDGHCSVCAGQSSFVISSAASKALREQFDARQARAAAHAARHLLAAEEAAKTQSKMERAA